MIIVKLWGGLCNQMFQYAFGYAQSKKYNDSLAFDVDFYKNQPNYVSNREFEISSAFAIEDLKVTERPRGVNVFQDRIISNIVRRITGFRFNLPNNTVYIRERAHRYMRDVYYCDFGINYYDGYWQSEKYFSMFEKDIKELFTFPAIVRDKVALWINTYEDSETVALHVRRGDMIRNAKESEAALDYYKIAIKMVSEMIDDPLFVVLSDDVMWCKSVFENINARFVFQDQHWSAVEDLCGISMCKHGIMSKSTFSWWGNWLGDNGSRIVIVPNNITFNNEFTPERWKCINERFPL